jgi:hypothetical protein
VPNHEQQQAAIVVNSSGSSSGKSSGGRPASVKDLAKMKADEVKTARRV